MCAVQAMFESIRIQFAKWKTEMSDFKGIKAEIQINESDEKNARRNLFNYFNSHARCSFREKYKKRTLIRNRFYRK